MTETTVCPACGGTGGHEPTDYECPKCAGGGMVQTTDGLAQVIRPAELMRSMAEASQTSSPGTGSIRCTLTTPSARRGKVGWGGAATEFPPWPPYLRVV
jgi:RecJ-like exonuclease